jgi:DNA-binding SARP family transcriptional activator/TolB-like protein
MGTSVGGTVETRPGAPLPALEIRVLGALTVLRDGLPVALPRSRKVRALLGFLALARGAVGRSRLCDLLWDVPNDPRAELRWCLSKVRSVIGDRIVAVGQETVALALDDCRVDALEVDAALTTGIEHASSESLIAVDARFGGDLLAGLRVDCVEYEGWLSAQRQRYRTLRIAVLEELARRSPTGSDDVFTRLHAWLQLAPFDSRAHDALLRALLQRGRVRDANEHLAATIRAFEQEGVDWQPLRESWRAARELSAQPITSPPPPASLPSPLLTEAPGSPDRQRVSVAVMPFVDGHGRVGDGLTEDIITRLAKLRVLFVIARGTVYALAERHVGPQEAGRILDTEYVVSGRVRRSADRLSVLIELAHTRSARIVWADELSCGTGASLAELDATVDRIVAAIAEEIEDAECRRAVLKPPSSLDAWEAYHRGLWHMYRFNAEDNGLAERFFRASLELDATFARAHSGLSFTHFQNAFLDLTADREQQIEQAFASAARSVGADDRDPAAHWAMGRALWLRGAHGESLAELTRSIDLSPNFALGHYTLGFVQSQAGDPRVAIEATDYSRQLSPFDPLQFAMLATRALAHVRLEQFEEAADWAVKATARPNAHAHILAIATESLVLADRTDEARDFVARIRSRLPRYGVEDFLRAFRFAPDTERVFRSAASKVGFG